MLLATRGIEPTWNDVEQSVGHRALLLSPNRVPVLAELAGQVADAEIPLVAKIYADPAATLAPDAPEFATAYCVCSVVGFGATVWPGESAAADRIRARCPRRDGPARVSDPGPPGTPAWLSRARHERRWGPRLTSGPFDCQRRRGGGVRERAGGAARRLAAPAGASAHGDAGSGQGDRQKIEDQNRHLRRTQRAMLNVVEDLHEARAALERRSPSGRESWRWRTRRWRRGTASSRSSSTSPRTICRSPCAPSPATYK